MADEYVFEMRAVFRRDDPYYLTNWNGATPIEVVAATKKEAINKADDMLGGSRDGRHWVFTVDRIRDVKATPDQKKEK